jgi:hypothetical protein
MVFNPNDYEMVEVRIRKFLDDHVDGRIITELINDEHDWIFKSVIYLGMGEQAASLPKAVGWATEKKGSSPFAAEVTETSSIGRALANMGLHGNKRASREEMRKVPGPSRDFITEAKQAKSADELRLLWTEAKAAGANANVLDEVKKYAEGLNDSASERVGGSASVSGSSKKGRQ